MNTKTNARQGRRDGRVAIGNRPEGPYARATLASRLYACVNPPPRLGEAVSTCTASPGSMEPKLVVGSVVSQVHGAK
jgi:hypothetical protein